MHTQCPSVCQDSNWKMIRFPCYHYSNPLQVFQHLILHQKLELVTVFLSNRNSHLHVILWAKHRLLRGGMRGDDSRVPDQLSQIKVSSVIKFIPPQTIYSILVCSSKILVAMETAKKASHDIARL